MKKLIALVLTIAMVATMGVVAFAAKGGFVYSPSVNPTPTIDDVELPEDCDGEINITPYPERDTLPEDNRQDLEDAYDDILNLEDGDDLDEIIEDLADENDIPADNLLVSDLFDLSYEGCDDHTGHTYTIQLSSDAFNNFVGIVHYENGTWVNVDDVTMLDDNTIRVAYDGYGPFAVVVDASDTNSPVTGDYGIVNACVVVMLLSAVGFVAAFIISKKRKAAAGR